MGFLGFLLLSSLALQSSTSCTDNGQLRFLENCSSEKKCECGNGLYCFSCHENLKRTPSRRCIRSKLTDQFKLLNNSLPFNKYAYLATHNSFAINGEPLYSATSRATIINQDDSVTQQLHNGVRALMLDTYDYEGDVWLCHSFKGKCHAYTAFKPAVETLKEIEAFLRSNPTEIVTLILEDYVQVPDALSRVFNDSGLSKFRFPLSKMPRNAEDWPLVKDMVANNHRLLVFTSMESKQAGEGIAYQWNFMVENQYGNGGMEEGKCFNRRESTVLSDRNKSLVLINHFRTVPLKATACKHNSGELIEMLHTCYSVAGNRWPNFVAVDFYKRSNGGGAFEAVETLNAQLLCNVNDLQACKAGQRGEHAGDRGGERTGMETMVGCSTSQYVVAWRVAVGHRCPLRRGLDSISDRPSLSSPPANMSPVGGSSLLSSPVRELCCLQLAV